MKVTNTNDPRAPLFVAVLFAVAGALQLCIYWNGRISMRVVAGLLFLFGSLVWFLRYIRLRNAQKKGHDDAA
jgi:hypothetical protein